MPKLTSRSVGCKEAGMAPSLVEACSYRGKDLSRCIADAINEPSEAAIPGQQKSKAKKRARKRGKKTNKDIFNGQFGRRKSVDENENTLLHSYSSMVYSAAVRNSILRKIDLSNIPPPSSDTPNNCPDIRKDSSNPIKDSNKNSADMKEMDKISTVKSEEKTHERIPEHSMFDNNPDLLSFGNDLLSSTDFEMIEEATWELVSLSDCSSVSDDDEFLILTDDEDDFEDEEKGIHEVAELTDKEDEEDETLPPTAEVVATVPAKKKYIAATRKFVAGADFEEKLAKEDFDDDGEDENEVHHFSGEFMQSLMTVQVSCKGGVRVVSVRCLGDNILQCLGNLQLLMKRTGLNSYSTMSIPNSGAD